MKNTKRINSIKYFVSALIIIVATNIIFKYVFFRVDLTYDKRFSLSESTKTKLKEIEDIIYIKVYLEGDLTADFQMLRNSTKEILDEFRAYNKNIQYEFIDPSESEDKEERFKVYRQLASEGLAYYNIPVETKDGFAQKTVFPSAMVMYREQTYPIELLVSNLSTPTEADINNSVQKLELNFLTAFHYITAKKIKSIGFTTGHGEIPAIETADIAFELSKNYLVNQVEINGQINSLNRRTSVDSNHTVLENNFDLIIIAKPDSAFSEKDKFIIDQYIMNGGKVIWLLDMVDANMDSLRNNTRTIGMPKATNLEDMLFRYGVRIRPELVLNRNALEIGTAERALRRWDYFPIAMPNSSHKTSSNVNTIKTQFVNPIDTVNNRIGKKSIILKTADFCRLMPAPVDIDVVDIIYRRPNPSLYNKPAQNLGVLIEGVFKSNYENRIGDPAMLTDKDLGIKYTSKPTALAFFSDGDIIRNQVIEQSNGPYPLPLGFDRFTQKMFDNKKFILNTVNYMLGDLEMIDLRSKEFKIRLLDKNKMIKEKVKWQLINTIFPFALILIFGTIMIILKKRSFQKI